MNTLPLFFKLENRPVLVVGGGEVALRKADLLDKAGATITFVAPSYEPRLIAQLSGGADRDHASPSAATTVL